MSGNVRRHPRRPRGLPTPSVAIKAGEAGKLVARETGDEHASPFPFPSSLARPSLSQRERRTSGNETVLVP